MSDGVVLGEQLDFEAPMLPDGFLEYWRTLERAEGIPRAGVTAHAITRSGWLIIVVDGRKWAALTSRMLDVEGARLAADELWKLTGRP